MADGSGGGELDPDRWIRRRYADASWDSRPATVVWSVPTAGTGQVTVQRVLIDEDRPELGWEWNALWLDPPGRPPGHVAVGDRSTRASSVSGPRTMVLDSLESTSALSYLIRADLVDGKSGDEWVALPALELIRDL